MYRRCWVGVSCGVLQRATDSTANKKTIKKSIGRYDKSRMVVRSITLICKMQGSDHNGRMGGRSGEVIHERYS
jgi:hypothetical protein